MKKTKTKPTAKKEQKMKPMRGIPEADAFIRRNISFVPIEEINGHFAEILCCIDGRRTADPDRLSTWVGEKRRGLISFPGGGVGVAALILSAINVAFIEHWTKTGDERAQSAQERFNFARVMECLERSLGGMSCHTDEHAAEDALACAGCGHAMALLTGGYGLGEAYRADMIEYLKKLKERALAGEEGIVVEVYKGAHAESAALRLKCTLALGEFLSIPPNDGEMSAFVFSEKMALEVLRKIAGLLYEEMRSDFKDHGIAKEEFLTHVSSLYYSHVRSSAFKLAHDLPVYDINHFEAGKVEVRKSDLRY